MTYLTAFLLGLVQGVAEFLPISSSGHLAIAQNLLGLEGAGSVPARVGRAAASLRRAAPKTWRSARRRFPF